MGFFKKMREQPDVGVQLRRTSGHPFGLLSDYVPLGGKNELKLYRTIREAVPIIDAAILKLIRLTGGFTVTCSSAETESELNYFLRHVNVGRGQRGIDAFLNCYLDSMITCGRAVGEIVLRDGRDIGAVLCGNIENIEIREKSSPLEFEVCMMGPAGQIEPLPYQELILFTPHDPDADRPYGTSMLRSMPFLADVLLKIYHSIGVNWERVGNVRFAVVYKPQGDIIDRAYAKERSEQIAREWSNAMQSGKNGSIRDFVAVGDVDIRVIGADNQVLDSEVPVRQILEQLVARTGIPPCMLGLSWNTTERMSSQQADIMTSEITAIRRSLEPVIERICEMWLRLHGKTCSFEVEWSEINLQDAVEEAHAELYHAQADKLKTENVEREAENEDL